MSQIIMLQKTMLQVAMSRIVFSRFVVSAALVVSLTMMSLLVTGCSRVKIPTRPEDVQIVSHDLELKKPQIWTTRNGLTVMFQENDELPLVEGALLFRGGSLNQGGGRAGLAAAAGQLLREGGVQGMSPETFDRRLESLGAKIESQIGEENGSVVFSGLSSDFPEIFDLFSQVILKPAFARERLELWREISLEGIRRRDEEPATVAQVVFREVMFGLDSPYAGITTLKSVKRIRREDVVKFYNSLMRPNGSILVLTGAVTRPEIERLVEEKFGGWGAVNSPIPPAAEVQQTFKPGIYVVEMPFQQAAIYGGHFGPKRLSPDHYAISVFNRYLAGPGFGSLMFSRIRSKEGLAYAVDGGFNPGANTGYFDLYIGTRVSEVSRAITSLLTLLQEVQVEPPAAEIFDEVLDSAENAYVFQFSTPQAVAMRAALLQLLEYPAGYDETYVSRLRSVQPADVRSVGERLVHPKDLALVVVGDVKAQDLANQFGHETPVYRVKFSTVTKAVERLKPRPAAPAEKTKKKGRR